MQSEKKQNYKMTIQIIIITLNLIAVVFPCSTLAWVTGPCANCHTMHASQTPWPDEWSEKSKLPQQYLLATAGSSACVGCHSHDTKSDWYELGGCKVPIVYTRNTEPSTYLAGGNFYWVKEGKQNADDSKGHNVFYGEGDGNLTAAPGDMGFAGCVSNCCHKNLHLPQGGVVVGPDNIPLAGGEYGCQGCHLRVRHHARDHLNFESGLVGLTGEGTVEEAKGWYRFLAGHMSGAKHGVRGYEYKDWEAGHPNHTPGGIAHNEYLGFQKDGGYGFGGLGHTTTAFCTGCHGVFHSKQKSGSFWVRHPSDAVIPDSGEYKYVGGAGHLYDPLSPVARPSIPTTEPDKVTPDIDFVMCLSCHRPHGSPYPDILRWNYVAQEAGGGGADTGCFYCHTETND